MLQDCDGHRIGLSSRFESESQPRRRRKSLLDLAHEIASFFADQAQIQAIPNTLRRPNPPIFPGAQSFSRATSYASNSTAQNVIQHDVKFQIVTNGGVTPTWKLVNFTANTSGQFFSLDRDRTQDLLMTFGPAQKNPNTDEPE